MKVKQLYGGWTADGTSKLGFSGYNFAKWTPSARVPVVAAHSIYGKNYYVWL